MGELTFEEGGGGAGRAHLARVEAERDRHHQTETLHPTPYILHHQAHTLHPTSFTTRPTPYTLHPSPPGPHPTPYTLHPSPPLPGRNPKDSSSSLLPSIIEHYTLNPQPLTLNQARGKAEAKVDTADTRVEAAEAKLTSHIKAFV